MADKNCEHTWEMVNITPGFIISEKCHRCNKISTYFSFDKSPPMEEYREGEHFWNVMESAQSNRFDLKCTQCGKTVELKELLGLMMCTACDEYCDAGTLMKKLEPERKWLYVAFGFLPVEEKKQLSEEQLTVIEEYFNQLRKSGKSKIKIIPSTKIRDVSTCYAHIIRDVDMLSLQVPETA
jgi:hypothetical protein